MSLIFRHSDVKFSSGITCVLDTQRREYEYFKCRADLKVPHRSASLYASLGMAYAGTAREDVIELLMPLIVDSDLTIELSSFAALSCGLVAVGTCNDEICGSIIQVRTCFHACSPHTCQIEQLKLWYFVLNGEGGKFPFTSASQNLGSEGTCCISRDKESMVRSYSM